MISFEEYREIVFELMEELPDEFFRELSGGVITSEGVSVPDYAQGNDLWILGKYQVFSRVRQITMYKGSFDRADPHADAHEAREILRGVLRHEIRHLWAASMTIPLWRRRTNGRSRSTCIDTGSTDSSRGVPARIKSALLQEQRRAKALQGQDGRVVAILFQFGGDALRPD